MTLGDSASCGYNWGERSHAGDLLYSRRKIYLQVCIASSIYFCEHQRSAVIRFFVSVTLGPELFTFTRINRLWRLRFGFRAAALRFWLWLRRRTLAPHAWVPSALLLGLRGDATNGAQWPEQVMACWFIITRPWGSNKKEVGEPFESCLRIFAAWVVLRVWNTTGAFHLFQLSLCDFLHWYLQHKLARVSAIFVQAPLCDLSCTDSKVQISSPF